MEIAPLERVRHFIGSRFADQLRAGAQQQLDNLAVGRRQGVRCAPRGIAATRGPARHVEQVLDRERRPPQRAVRFGLDHEAMDEGIG